MISRQLPILTLLQIPIDELRTRGEKLIGQLRGLPLQPRLVASKAEIGGGALPRSVIPSVALEFASGSHSPNELATLLRRARPPIIGYLAQGRFQLDLRTIFPEQDELLVAALTACLTTRQA